MTHNCEVYWVIFLSFLRRYSRFCVVGYRLFSRYDVYIYITNIYQDMDDLPPPDVSFPDPHLGGTIGPSLQLDAYSSSQG